MDKQQLRELLEKATPGPAEARVVHKDWPMPVEPCLYAIVSTSQRIEIARMWTEADARLYAFLRNHASELLEAAESADNAEVKGYREGIAQGIFDGRMDRKRAEFAEERAAAAEAQRDRLAKALRPFAAIAASISKIRDDNGHFYAINETVITYGDFRRAAEALKEAGNGE